MTAVDNATTPLTYSETTRLLQLESIVTAGLDTFVAVGIALAEIQASKLYRAAHDTFDAYVRQQFQLSRSRAYEIIGSATTFEALSAMADIPLPQNERQARALTGLAPSEAAEVMVTAAAAGPITARTIAAARNGSTVAVPEPSPLPGTAPARRRARSRTRGGRPCGSSTRRPSGWSASPKTTGFPPSPRLATVRSTAR